MGKAARWFGKMTMCCFGLKKYKERVRSSSSNCSEKEKNIWSLAKSSEDPRGIADQIPANHLALRRSSYASQREKLRKKHADAVTAATAAAADAAAAVAEAALAVARARLSTSQGGGDREKWAATKIQKIFRGYLARKAFRALKALVKVQALFRGHLVRKQMAAICMQALIRAQAATILSGKPCYSIYNNGNFVTPLKPFCGGDTFFRYPNYMSGTESSRAKLKPPITPNKIPEPGEQKRLLYTGKMASRSSFSDGVITQASRDDIMASRPSFSEVRMRKRSLSGVPEYFSFCNILT